MAAAKKKATKKKSAKAASLGHKASKGELTKGSSKAKGYKPSDTYKVGELVFHPVWQDEGPVVEVTKTEDGIEKVIVDFAEIGLKHLVMNYELDI